MEDELEIKSSLLAPPKKDMMSLSNAQLGFMNMFAIPLFQGVVDILPAMGYTVEELEINKSLFEQKVKEQKAKQLQSVEGEELGRLRKEGTFSPRTRSFVIEKEEDSTKTARAENGDSDEATDDMVEVEGQPPSAPLDVQRQDRLEMSPVARPLTAKSTEFPRTPISHHELNGAVFGSTSSFDAVRELADSDPFNCRNRGDSSVDGKSMPSGRHRCSETTEGSTSGAFAGDWASQATSTATGKIALSPSTQGTSIVSNDSIERTLSAPGLNMSPPSAKGSPVTVHRGGYARDEESIFHGGSLGRADGKALKKKPSRFRMKDFPFFRRNKGTSPPFPAADTTG